MMTDALNFADEKYINALPNPRSILIFRKLQTSTLLIKTSRYVSSVPLIAPDSRKKQNLC